MSPCYQCTDRYPGCHQYCDKHMLWKDAEDRRKETICEAKNRERKINEYNADNANAWRRRHG